MVGWHTDLKVTPFSVSASKLGALPTEIPEEPFFFLKFVHRLVGCVCFLLFGYLTIITSAGAAGRVVLIYSYAPILGEL